MKSTLKEVLLKYRQINEKMTVKEFIFSAKLQAEGLEVCQKYTPLKILSTILCSELQLSIVKWFSTQERLFPRTSFQQLLLTVARFSKYSFLKKLLYIFRAGDQDLRKPKDTQRFERKSNSTKIAKSSNIQYTAICRKFQPRSFLTFSRGTFRTHQTPKMEFVFKNS